MAKETKNWFQQNPGRTAIGAIVLLVLILVMWIGGTYNSLITLQINAENSWAQVETSYQRRLDLIPNLVATVKGVAEFEQETFEKITQARSGWTQAGNINDKIAAANQMESALARLLVVAENYPQLKANQNFLALQDELANTENKIAVERKRYNDAVRAYTVKTKTFPSVMIANMFGFEQMNYFESAQGAENAPTVDF